MILTGGKMFLQYGLVFLLTYFTILLSSRIKRSTTRALISGTLMSLQLVLISYLQLLLQWHNLSDGRNFFALFTVFFWGPLAGIPVAIGVLVISFMHPTLYLAQNLLITTLVSMVAYGYRVWIQKKQIKLKWPHILGIAITPTLIALPLANILYRGEVAVAQANNSIMIILISYTILTFAIIYANTRELERKENLALLEEANGELEYQNIEIRALYEEMAASEEALQESYSELNDYKNKLEFLAYHDSKTGMYNREFLHLTLFRLEKERPLHRVLLYLRVHHFEQIADTLGQSLAEILHSIVAKKIEDTTRQFKGYTGFQLGYGRFAILTADDDEASINPFLDQIFTELSSTHLVENMVLPIDLDVGAIPIDPHTRVQSLFEEYAEIAMLESAKCNIQNKIFWFSEEMYKSKQYQNRLEFDLQKGMTEQQFFIVVQPQYDADHVISGAEVLLRWRHPEFGLISPIVFIPLAERLGLIASIGQFVFNQTLDLASKLKELTALSIPLSINTSMIELVDLNFSGYINEKLYQSGIDHTRINIEITESALAKDMSHVQANLDHLLGFGISIHLDDFGTGYSSLSHLSQLPISHLKIDKAFIDHIQRNDKDLKVVQTIIELGHRLNMKVIAEGVELKEQLEILHRFGCDYYQGYYFSQPIPVDEFYGLF